VAPLCLIQNNTSCKHASARSCGEHVAVAMSFGSFPRYSGAWGSHGRIGRDAEGDGPWLQGRPFRSRVTVWCPCLVLLSGVTVWCHCLVSLCATPRASSVSEGGRMLFLLHRLCKRSHHLGATLVMTRVLKLLPLRGSRKRPERVTFGGGATCAKSSRRDVRYCMTSTGALVLALLNETRSK